MSPRINSAQAPAFEYTLTEPGAVSIPEVSVEVRADILPPDKSPDFPNAGHRTAFFDMNAISFPLTIRSIRPGDRFRPLGMGGTQKVKKYFIDRKIPFHKRVRCPVLVSGGQLVWLMGHRLGEAARITPNTRNVLKVSFSDLPEHVESGRSSTWP
jgi:tRNA(Ile)-lysidine synthase